MRATSPYLKGTRAMLQGKSFSLVEQAQSLNFQHRLLKVFAVVQRGWALESETLELQT